jgi:hypothetical protein
MKTRILAIALGCLVAGSINNLALAQDDIAGRLLQAASPILRGLCVGNQQPLLAQPLGGLPYLQAVVSPLHDPSLSWRIPPEVRLLELDPMLSRTLNTRMITDASVYRGTIDLGVRTGLGMIKKFAEAREQNEASGAFDPAAEITALMGGLVDGADGYGQSLAGAERDADVMIALMAYPETIETFRVCYDGLRTAVMSGS